MTLPPIFEFGQVVAYDSSVNKRERVVFRPTEPVNLAAYALLTAWQDSTGLIAPLNNNLFYFGDCAVTPPCWVVVYTGKGKYHQVNHAATGHLIHTFYWGNDVTVFNVKEVVPVLIRIANVQIGSHASPPMAWSELEKQLQLPTSPPAT